MIVLIGKARSYVVLRAKFKQAIGAVVTRLTFYATCQRFEPRTVQVFV